MDALNIKNLSKTFRSFKLEDINLSLPQGYIMGLVGRNGAGKTTLFKTIMNHLLKDDGSIKIYGNDHQHEEAKAKSMIAYVSDLPNLPPDMSLHVLRSSFATVYPEWDEAKYKNLCQRFSLNSKSKYGSLSRGMQTKFNIALALSHNASLILLDEPTAGLDPIVRREVLDLLREELQDETKAVLLSTHITSDLDGIADYLTIIDGGRILMSENREVISDEWRVLKLEELPDGFAQSSVVKGISKTAWGYSVLVSNMQTIRGELPQDLVSDRPNFEDIMYHLVKGA